MHNSWPPFRGWISIISWLSVVAVLLGFAGLVEKIRVWLEIIHNPIIDWYLANSWVLLVIVFVAWVFLWGTYKTYQQEKQARTKCERELGTIKGEDAKQERRIKKKQERKVDLEVKQLESQQIDVQLIVPEKRE